MLTCCLKCKRNTKNIDSKMVKIKNSRLALSSKYAICGSFLLRTRSKRILE